MDRKDIMYIAFIIALATISLVNFFFNNFIVAGVATAVTLGLYGFVILVGWFFFFKQTAEEEYAALTRTGGRLSDLSDRQLRKLSKESLRKAIKSRKRLKILREFIESMNRETSSTEECSRFEAELSPAPEPELESVDVTPVSSPTSTPAPAPSTPAASVTPSSPSTPSVPPAPIVPVTPSSPSTPSVPPVSTPTPTPASSLVILKYASRQAKDLSRREGLNKVQLAGLTPSGARGTITVDDIRNFISSASSPSQ